MNRAVVSQPALDTSRRFVSFEGRRGRIYYSGGAAKLSGEVLEVVAGPPRSAFAFSDGSFRFGRQGRELDFSDSSGRYRLALEDMLGEDGALNRKAPLRLAVRR